MSKYIRISRDGLGVWHVHCALDEKRLSMGLYRWDEGCERDSLVVDEAGGSRDQAIDQAVNALMQLSERARGMAKKLGTMK